MCMKSISTRDKQKYFRCEPRFALRISSLVNIQSCELTLRLDRIFAVCSASVRALFVPISIRMLMSRSIIQLQPAFAFISAAPSCVVCAGTVAPSCSLLHSLTMSGDRSKQAVKNYFQAQQLQALPAITASAQILPLRDLGPLNLSQEAVQQ